MGGLEYVASECATDKDHPERLVADPWYQRGYAARGGDTPGSASAGIHAPFRTAALTPDVFVTRVRDEARGQLDIWLVKNNATTTATNTFRFTIDGLLSIGHRIYELRGFLETARHECGWVVGSDTGFLDYVAIAPDVTTLKRARRIRRLGAHPSRGVPGGLLSGTAAATLISHSLVVTQRPSSSESIGD